VIGPILARLIFGRSEAKMEQALQEIQEALNQQTEDVKQTVIDALEDVLEHSPPQSFVVAVGSGNTEHLLELDEDVKFGQKHIVRASQHIGGSGVNYSMRLINQEVPVLPVLSITNDEPGAAIQKRLADAATKNHLPSTVVEFIGSDEFLQTGVGRTPRSTILVKGDEKTIFTEAVEGQDAFKQYLDQRFSYVERTFGRELGAVIIGHIYADAPEQNAGAKGECTRQLIHASADKHFVIANFGDSQLRHGRDFWSSDLRRVSVFQLNLEEMRTFCSGGATRTRLVSIIQWLKREGITAVITLDRFGAIATHRDRPDAIILAWPVDLDGSDCIRDSTGAGDAFCAALAARLRGRPRFSFGEFMDAIDEARVCGAYACTTLGGATECPTRRRLDSFREEFREGDMAPMEVVDLGHDRRVLNLLDRAYGGSS
jgi:sugar/nucleoside kinase (ribokinase family)